MSNQIDVFIKNLKLKPPATEDNLKILEQRIDICLPVEYREFMLNSNGAEGFIGNSYLQIWSVEQTMKLNERSAADETLCLFNESKPVVCFASDGGGTYYAFDKRTDDSSIIAFSAISIVSEEHEQCGDTFNKFLQHLYN